MSQTQRGQLIRDDSMNPVGWKYANITTKADTIVKATPGFLHGITINKIGSTDTLAIYDNTAASSTLIGTITPQAGVGFYPFDVAFNTGLSITSGGGTAGDYTVIYV